MKRRTFLKIAALTIALNPIRTLAVVPNVRAVKTDKRPSQLKVHPLELPDDSIMVR